MVRHRVNKVLERRTPAEGEVVTLGVKRGRHAFGWKALEAPCQFLGVKACRIDEHTAAQFERIVTPGAQQESV